MSAPAAALRAGTYAAGRPGPHGLRALFDTQRAAFVASPPGYAQRAEALDALMRAIRSREADIIAAVAEDFGGRPREETQALELVPLLTELRHARRNLARWMAPRRAAVPWHFWPAQAKTVYRPRGIIGVLSTWNYPFYLTLAPLAGILAAGNHALIKPSELAPASAAVIQSMLTELFPASWVAVITGGADVAEALTRLPLDHLLFTGSARVGRRVLQAASENLVPVTLELGGKSPAILHADYPLETAAARILAAKLYNAGQTCVAPDYVMVPEGRAAGFVQAAERAIADMFPASVGSRDYTRIINVHHYRRLTTLVTDARERGAAVIEAGPSALRDPAHRIFPPTLVTGVRDGMAVMDEEIFGPILPVIEYGRIEEAITYVNARPHPLALYYFDNDRSRAERLLVSVAAGGATVNDCLIHVGLPTLPFGGVGPSGMGKYHGFDGFETFSHKQGVMLQRRWSPLALLRPPYTRRTARILRWLLR